MQIKFDANKKRLDTTPAFGLLVQGENLAESIQITGPKMVGALDLSQLRVAVRMTSQQYETTVEKTLEQTTDGDTITFTWQVDKQFTGSPGKVDVMLVGYGGNEEVIKITSSGMVVQEDRTFDTAPPESTWEQILQQMQDFTTQAYESKTAAENSAAEAAASQKVAEEKAEQATNAANEAVKAAETAAADAAAQAAAKTEQQIRQYADDRYARALQGTADPAASITIYPDTGSNVAVTAHGFTIQEGEGDASPANQRPIVNGGVRLTEFVLDGNAVYSDVTVNTNTVQFSTKPGGVNTVIEVGYCEVLELKSGVTADYPHWFPSKANKYLTFYFPRDYFGATDKPSIVDALNKNPIKAWYQDADGTGSLYAPITGVGEGFTGVCGKLTAPLCQGDTLITKVKSGCDKMVVLKGDPSENWSKLSYPTLSRFMANGIVGADNGTIWCNKLGVGYGQNQIVIGVGNTKPSVFLDATKFPDVEDWTNELAQAYSNGDPYILFYQSTNYTPAADIPVSLEIHVRAVFTPDGTEPWKWDKSSGANVYRGVLSNVYPKAKSGFPMCSHAKSQTTYLNTNGVTSEGSTFTLAFPDIQMESGVDTFKEYISSQYTGKTPITIVYKLESPITYAHEPVDFIASPGEDGAWVITGEENGQVSAVYNKNLTHTIAELQAALLAVSAKLSL